MTDRLSPHQYDLNLGAAFQEAKIFFHGDSTGEVIRGDFGVVAPGLYEAVFDLEFVLPTPKMPALVFSLVEGGVALASIRVSTHAPRVSLPVQVLGVHPLELVVESRWTLFSLAAFSLRKLDPAELPALSAPRRRGVLARRAVGFDQEPLAEELTGRWSDPGNVVADWFRSTAFTFLPAGSLHEHEELLRTLGLSPGALAYAFRRDNTDYGVRAGEAAADLVQGKPGLSNGWHPEMVRAGAFRFPSPFDGRVLESRSSILAPTWAGLATTVYEFDGDRPFVVGVSNGWTGTISFAWFLDLDLVVHDNPYATNWISAADVIAEYVARCIRHRERIAAYRPTPKSLALVSGYINNMGHFFWNEVSGVERLVRLTGLEAVQAVYTSDAAWISMGDVFEGELAAPVEHADLETVFERLIDRRQLALRPVGIQLDETVAAKVRRGAERRLCAEHPERLARMDAVTSAGDYVVFVNLRVHNKAWVEQEEGLVRALEALQQAGHERLLVYLDGYKDCLELAAALERRSPPGVSFVDGTQAIFAETLCWAFRCDFFLAVIGSGLVPLTWLADKPGVCYGDTRHIRQMNWWFNVRPNSVPVRWPPLDAVRDVQDVFQSDFHLDPDLVVELVRQVLAGLRTAEEASALIA